MRNISRYPHGGRKEGTGTHLALHVHRLAVLCGGLHVVRRLLLEKLGVVLLETLLALLVRGPFPIRLLPEPVELVDGVRDPALEKLS